MRYADALALQHRLGAELEQTTERTAQLILLQHTPVYTLGRTTAQDDLPVAEDALAARTGAEVVRADRGGSVTYHGPGQLTAYLLLNLKVWDVSIQRHLELLEEAALRTLVAFGIRGAREPGMTGVWVGAAGQREKICAIGVSARRWVTYHGLSLNVDLDLAPFAEIIPCGLAGKRVTSVAQVLGHSVSISGVATALARACGEAYEAPVELARE
jgi:lipoyl(octanoyl) transferase